MDNDIEDLKRQIEELKDKIHAKETGAIAQNSINTEEVDECVWEAPVRVFIPWQQRKIITVFLWVGILSLILIFLKEYVLLITVILITLVSISLVIVPPARTKHKLTNKGIITYEKLYLWEDLASFWLADRKGTITMYINTKLPFPTRLFLIIPHENLQSVIEALSKHLPYYERRDKQGSIGKMSDGVYIKYNDIKTYYPSPAA